ncbi:MAG TPA: hypothetical protein VMV29_18495 [Ktedonobacterales bacterium]|nr:hypothetical protein [Ktedonobacterales bacterium]
MATIRNATSTATRNATSATTDRTPAALARLIALTGLFIGAVGSVDYLTFFYVTQHETPLMVFQYIASGLLGPSAFAGGYSTALLGLLIHFVISFVVAACSSWSPARSRSCVAQRGPSWLGWCMGLRSTCS